MNNEYEVTIAGEAANEMMISIAPVKARRVSISVETLDEDPILEVVIPQHEAFAVAEQLYDLADHLTVMDPSVFEDERQHFHASVAVAAAAAPLTGAAGSRERKTELIRGMLQRYRRTARTLNLYEDKLVAEMERLEKG
jgi:hypothetical protein